MYKRAAPGGSATISELLGSEVHPKPSAIGRREGVVDPVAHTSHSEAGGMGSEKCSGVPARVFFE